MAQMRRTGCDYWRTAATSVRKAAALQGGLGNAIANANRETSRRRQERLREARHALGRTLAAAAKEHGKAMNLATAAEYALMLTDPGPPRSAPGPGKLNARERVRPSVTTLPSRSGRATARTPRLPTIWGGPTRRATSTGSHDASTRGP